MLKEGNLRFQKGEANPKCNAQQSPKAIVLCCSDARVPVELIFDVKVGDLFVVRVAGNVLGAIELESILFAARNFDPELILVLGHENCGAITAALNQETKDYPALRKALSILNATNLHDAMVENIQHGVDELKGFPDLKHIKVVGGYFELKTGVVHFI